MQCTEGAAEVHMLVSKHSDSLETDTGRLSHDKMVQHRRQHGTAASQIGERYGEESNSTSSGQHTQNHLSITQFAF